LGLFAAVLMAAHMAAAQGPQPALPSVTLQAGMHLIRAEVAASYGTRMQGLMFREKMASNDGMLFVFPAAERQCMWMRNTILPLSVAFLADDGTILNIEDMKPHTEDAHCSAKPSRYALEMNHGWFKSKGVLPGSKIGGLDKAGPPRP
jgi:hypothetical protein